MKILFLSKDLFFNGGGERMLVNLANALTNENSVSILTFDYSTSQSIFEINKDIKIKRANIKRRKINLLTKVDYIKYLYSIKKELNTFDVIIGVGIICNLVLSYISRRIDTKTIAWEHFSYSGTPYYQKVLRKFLFKNLTKVVILTNEDLPKYKKLNNNSVVIYNFSEMENRIKYNNSKQIIFIGRLSKQKGIVYLKKIIKDFDKTNTDWIFKIIGKGEYKKSLIKFINTNHLNDKIVLQDISNDIQTELEKSGIIIMTSIGEGLPMVLIEAQICGIPAISFNTQTGPSEIIKNDETGFLVPCYNTNEFVKKLEYLTENEKLRFKFSDNCLDYANRFNKNCIIEQWKNMLRNIK